MASSEYRDVVDFAPLENEFKKHKCRAKSNFTRSRTKLSDLLEENATFNRREIKDARKRMETCLELVMGVLTNFSDFYTKYGEHQKSSWLLVVLRLNVPVNNFSVMSGRSHRFLGN